MRAVLIGEEGQDMFLNAVPKDVRGDCDVLIGAVDEEEDCACGVLGAEALDGHKLGIRVLYMDQKYRRRGGGRAMVDLLKNIAAEIEAGDILCAHPADAGDGVEECLLRCGFVAEQEEDEMELFSYVRDL